METKVLNDVPIKSITLNPDNPRYNRKTIEEVIKSIQACGYVSPIVINEKNMILAGNTRYKALLALKYKTIPIVVKASGLTKDQEDRFILADNKTQEFSSWDFSKLRIFDEDMLKGVGFSAEELDKIFGEGGGGDPDSMPKLPDKKYDIQEGDVWACGEHTVMCGDSLQLKAVKTLCPVKQTFGFTSPPFWVGMDYEKEKSLREIDDFITDACRAYDAVIDKDASRIVINTGFGMSKAFDKKAKWEVYLLIDKWVNGFKKLGWLLRHCRHWMKDGHFPRPGVDIIDMHSEMLGTFENGKGKGKKFDDVLVAEDAYIMETFYNQEGKNGNMNFVDPAWALKGYWYDIKGTAASKGHCASMPVEIVRRNLLMYTSRGSGVVDLFGGAGTTMVACHMLGRKCFTMEKDPKYVALMLERYSIFAKDDPVRMKDGVPWSKIKSK